MSAEVRAAAPPPLEASGLIQPAELADSWVGEHRRARLARLIPQAFETLDEAIAEHVTGARRTLASISLLFSGGNDSTVLSHLFRQVATNAIHINTGIGVPATLEYVRDTSSDWRLKLIEGQPPAGSTYDELVLDQGFPGPAHHWKMYQRLKERALHKARNELIANPYRQRVVFLAGRRRSESQRRANVPKVERNRSIVWVSPLAEWTTEDLNTYRAVHLDVPRNPVSDLLHMSGECLCGSFAKPDELDEIGMWFPTVRERIEILQSKVEAAGHPKPRCRWGWGADADRVRPSRSGPMCSSCQLDLFSLPEFAGDAA